MSLPSADALGFGRLSGVARYQDALLFVLLAALFGGSFAAIKTGLRELPPVLFAGFRFDLAALALLAYVAAVRPRSSWLPQTRGDALGIIAGAVFLVALNNGLLFVGQGLTTPAAASVMYGLNPILAPVFAWWLLGDRLSTVGVIGLGVALAGVVVIVRPSPSTLADPASVGQVLVVGAAAAVAFGSVTLRRVTPRMDSLPLTAWAMAAGAVLLHAASAAAGEPFVNPLSVGTATAASVVVVALPSTAVAYAIYFGLVRRIGPVRTNLVAYAVPVFAALTGWLALGAGVSAWTVIGFAVVVVGFGLIERETLQAEFRRVRRRTQPSPSADADSDTDASDD